MTSGSAPARLVQGRYRLDRELGRGATATVYLAQDLKHDRPVAFKLLRAEVSAGLDAERFRREIATAARLQHPHICSVYDSGDDEGRLWFTMPYVRGETLRDRLRREKRLPLGEALRITRQAAQALAYAHREGVVHRDVKPENILLTDDGVTLVADFGIARLLDRRPGEHLTEFGHAIGTPSYMAPEQAMGEPADGRADQYALAVTCYEMLAGAPPHAGPTIHAVIARRLTSPPAPIRSHRDDIPAATDLALTRGLALAPPERYPTMSEFADALTEADPRLRAGRRVPLRAWMAGALVPVALVTFLVRRTPPPAPPAEPTRLAVLPFENLGDSADAFFAAGMAEEMRGKLANLPGLEVIARSSSSQYHGGRVPPDQIARELGVRYLLTGTVRWEKGPGGSRVRVSPELIEAQSGVTRWQQPFDAAITDVFAVQADIARQVAGALHLALADSTRARLAVTPTRSVDAYARFLRSRDLRSGEISPEVLRASISELERAVSLDPNFASAWADLTLMRVDAFRLGGLLLEDAEAARSALDRAVALAPSSPDTRAAGGRYRMLVDGDPAAALLEYREGLRVAPNRSDLLTGAGLAEMDLGRWTEALRDLEHAVRIDPRSPDAAGPLDMAYFRLRRYPEARGQIDRARLLRPYSMSLAHNRARLAAAEGDLNAVRRTMRAMEPIVGTRSLVAYVALREDLIWSLEDDYMRLVLTLTPADLDGGRGDWALALAEAHRFRGDFRRSRAYADSAVTAYTEMLTHWGDRVDRGQMVAIRAFALALSGRLADAVAEAGRAGAIQPLGSSIQGSYVAYLQARIHVLAGQPDRAIERLAAILAHPDYRSPGWLRIDRTLAGLRGMPAFERLTAGGVPSEGTT